MGDITYYSTFVSICQAVLENLFYYTKPFGQTEKNPEKNALFSGYKVYYVFLLFDKAFRIKIIPVISARNHPIGTAHHIPFTPINGTGEST